MSRRRLSLSSVGEFAEIARLSASLGSTRFSPHVIRSIGDDAAVLRPPRNHDLLFTTDALIESVHFDRRWDMPADIGWKALAANLSDIAAMHGAPLAAVITLGLPRRTPVRWIDDLYAGLRRASQKYNTPIVGGDTVRSPRDIMISIALLGSVPKGQAIYRDGAQPGDTLFVTGTLGSCAAALHAVSGRPTPAALAPPLFRKHRRPVPRFDIIEALHAKRVRATSMIDVSDGLVSDAGHLCEESHVAIEVDSRALPIAPALRRYAAQTHCDVTTWALHSGEEYELIFTCPARDAKRVQSIKGVTCIGRVARGRGVYDIASGRRVVLTPAGFKHFGA